MITPSVRFWTFMRFQRYEPVLRMAYQVGIDPKCPNNTLFPSIHQLPKVSWCQSQSHCQGSTKCFLRKTLAVHKFLYSRWSPLSIWKVFIAWEILRLKSLAKMWLNTLYLKFCSFAKSFSLHGFLSALKTLLLFSEQVRIRVGSIEP